MAKTSLPLAASFLLLLISSSSAADTGRLFLTVVNHCPFTVWPAIQPNVGHPVLERGGFALPTNTHRSFYAPATHWSGLIWGRTGCSHDNGKFSCVTGDCGNRLECSGLGGSTPASIAQFDLHHGVDQDLSSYGVSLVDGFNVPMTVIPNEGRGECPVVGCPEDLLKTCPPHLQLRSGDGGDVVACKSGCEAFRTDELCCRNQYNSPQMCRASTDSLFFKQACPSTITFAYDSPSFMHDCSSPRELQVIFCP